MSKKYLIEDIYINKNSLKVSASRHFKKQWLLADFFAEYDEDVDLGKFDYSILQIPFLLNVIPIIWLSGEQYHIKSLDEDLAISLQEIRDTFRNMYPGTSWTGELIPDRLVSNAKISRPDCTEKSDHIGVLFSGGVDSVCTSFRHMNKPQVLITVWGSNVALENATGWAITRDKCKQFGRIHGHDNAFIKSNFFRFLYTSKLKTVSKKIPNWWTHAQHGLGFAGLTAPLLIQRECTKLFIASTHTPEYKGAWGSDYPVDNKLRWAGIPVIHDSFDWSRQTKIRFIRGICENQRKPRPVLTVCMRADMRISVDNCGTCEKCLRTITGLLLEGENTTAYGFNIPAQEAVMLIRAKFASQSLPVDENGTFFWKDLQTRSSEVLAHSAQSRPIDHDLRSYFQWLSSFDLDEYRIRYEENSRPHFALKMIRKFMRSTVMQFPMLARALQKWKEEHYYRSASRRLPP